MICEHAYFAEHSLNPHSIYQSHYLIGRNFVGRKWRIFLKVTKISSDENFTGRSFAQLYNHNLSKWHKSLVGSVALHFKTLLFLLGETFRRAKVAIFSFSGEKFARRIVLPDKNFARQSFAQLGISFLLLFLFLVVFLFFYWIIIALKL